MGNYNILRFFDSVLGICICFLITVFNRLLLRFKPKPRYEVPVKKILVMKFLGLGSILLASPVLRSLKKEYPDAKITFLTINRNKEICSLISYIDDTVTVRFEKGILVFLYDLVLAVLKLRALKYDLLLDLEFFTRFSAILTYLINSKISVGFNTWEVWRGNFHTIKVPFNRYWHVTRIFANMLCDLGIEIDSFIPVRPRVGNAAKNKIKNIVKDDFYRNKLLIPVNVNNDSLGYERRWPKEYYIELINVLIKKYNVAIVLIGSQKEASYVNEVEKKITSKENLVNLAGKINIEELAALFGISNLLITNDSGPVHLATAMGLKSVSFFGPETPVLYGPEMKDSLVFYKNIDCSPCMNVHSSKKIKCVRERSECMEKITVKEVLEKIEEKYFKK